MAKKRSKTAIFSFVRLSKNSMVASVRIAYWLQEQLGCDMTWEGDIADLLPETLIIVNGAYGFSKFLEPLSRAILAAKYVVWVQNDYTIIPPKTDGDAESPFRKAFVTRKEKGQPDTIFWSTCEKWYERKGSHYVNWNQLTFDESYDPKIITKRRRTVSACTSRIASRARSSTALRTASTRCCRRACRWCSCQRAAA
jgi:hypothetical protein